ncbi:MAG: hypothetical protein M3Y35_07205, partial [Actinomycetota bacterium]|nr:hypothetical protein [Actinomycetota bacterium]
MPTLDLSKASEPGAAVGLEPNDESVEREDAAAVGAGLDALEVHTFARRPAWQRFLSGVYPP